METTSMPSMKPVLVTKVSDDIRDLRKSDVVQQKTAFSARAIADVFAGDEVKETNDSDKKYFVSVTTESGAEKRIDVDLLIDSGCRYLPYNSIIHGPERATSDGSATGETLSGFMYTLTVLPGGELKWNGNSRDYSNGGISYTEGSEPEASRNTVSNDSIIRQVFWVHSLDMSDVVAYTRIGKYNTASSKYVWGDWVLLGGEMLYIIVKDPAQKEIINPLVNSTYSIHCNVSSFALPEATSYKYGTKIRILQYPDPNETDRGSWFTRVIYTYQNESAGINEDFELLCTPSPNRNTAKQETAYLDGLSPTCYDFVVVPLLNDNKEVIGRTWELEVNAEETEFTTGLTEMLGAHTDVGTGDFIDYLNIHYREESTAYKQSAYSTLVFNRVMPCTGYVSGKISKLHSNLGKNWTVVVKYVATDTDANFKLVNTAVKRRPDEGVLYFCKRTITESGATRDVYELAVDSSGNFEPGYLDPNRDFETGKQFYTLANPGTAWSETICTVRGQDLQAGETYVFNKYLNRHNILYASIQPDSSQNHIIVRNGQFANVQISVIPDPHRGSYITKRNLNRSAYTAFQFAKLKEKNEFCTDIIDDQGSTATMEEVPASTQALANSYKYLAENLQARGLLTGIVDIGNLSSGALDALTTTGIYRATPYSPTHTLEPAVNDDAGWPTGTVTYRSADIVVLGSTVAPANMLHEESQYTPTTDETPVALTTYYVWNRSLAKFELSEGTNPGHPSSFLNANKPYYIKAPMSLVLSTDSTFVSGKQYYTYNSTTGTYTPYTATVGSPIVQPNTTYYEYKLNAISESNEITQIVYQYNPKNVSDISTQCATGMNMWYRHKINGGNWSPWMSNVKKDVFRASASATKVELSDITTALAMGVPHISCGNSSSSSTVSSLVILPLANSVIAGTKIYIEYTGYNNLHSLSFNCGTATGIFSHTFSGTPGDLDTIVCRSNGSTWYFSVETWKKQS